MKGEKLMCVNTVINHNQSAWQEVSLHWNDEISHKFHSSVMAELETILNSLNAACSKLELDTDNVITRLTRLNSL